MYGDKFRNTSNLYGIVGGSPERVDDETHPTGKGNRSRSKGSVSGRICNTSSFDLIKGDDYSPQFVPTRKHANFFGNDSKTFGKPTEVYK